MQVLLRRAVLSAVALAAFASAPRAAAAQARNVTGTYNTTITSPQGPVKAVIVLKKEGSAFAGTLSADGFPTMAVTTVTPSDAGVNIQVDTPDGGVAVAMKFGSGDKVSGTVVYQGAEMTLDGTFAPAGAGASAPASMGAISGVGVYELKSSEPLLGDANFVVNCLVTKNAAGAIGGTCSNPERGDVEIGTGSVAGNVIVISGDTPLGAYKLTLTVTGTAVAGTMSVGTETAKVAGKYTPR